MEEEYRKFTEEELEKASSTDLVELCEKLGYTIERVGGEYRLKEHDSLYIFPSRIHYHRFSDSTHGDAIGLLMQLEGMSFPDAVKALLSDDIPRISDDFVAPVIEKKPFVLPEKNKDHKRLYEYLQSRGLSKPTIDYFYKLGLVYEDIHHNCVFVGKDNKGKARYASKRGTGKETYKKDVSGSEKAYAFNVVHKDSTHVVFCEAPIDVMSYVEMSKDFKSNLCVLGGTAGVSLNRFLKDNPQIETADGLTDCDGAGCNATRNIIENELAVETTDKRPFEKMQKYHAKDLNEYLQHVKNPALLKEKEAEYDKCIKDIMRYGYTEDEAKCLELLFRYKMDKFDCENEEILKNKEYCKFCIDRVEYLKKELPIDYPYAEVGLHEFSKRGYRSYGKDLESNPI